MESSDRIAIGHKFVDAPNYYELHNYLNTMTIKKFVSIVCRYPIDYLSFLEVRKLEGRRGLEKGGSEL